MRGFWTRFGWRLDLEDNFGVLEHLVGLLGRLIHSDRLRAEALVFRFIQRFAGTDRENKALGALADKLAVLWVTYETEPAKDQIDRWIADQGHSRDILRTIIVTMREAVVAGLKPPTKDDEGLRHRAQGLIASIVESGCQALAEFYDAEDKDNADLGAAKVGSELIDIAAQELYFATGMAVNEDQQVIDDAGLETYLREVAPILMRIGDYASPHTVYNLLQLIEILVPIGPTITFDVTSHAVRTGGTMGGYQYESPGADVMVRLVGVFLADHKEIFEDDARRAALVYCLEIFMEAGWTSARRLLYRLPELIQ